METIKLVIWDLDETFWKGTLLEGEIQLMDDNIRIVKELTARGIINSVSSKNDYERAKNELIRCGVWEYFVFPAINWNPKGQQVKAIIESAQLRNVNVLFLDDNHLNLEEVKFYNKGINVALPDFIPELLQDKRLTGKDDTKLFRLNQYKILEQKYIAKASSTNEEFLKNSDIKIEFIDDLRANEDRIEELINRSNQLNFTKRRLSSIEISALVSDASRIQGAIRVVDKFGDYGLVGYYCLAPDQQELEHFVFSCRILNIGIEQFIYAHLNFPDLTVVGEVIGQVNKAERPDWISINSRVPQNNSMQTRGLRIFFKGGCDLSQMFHYIKEQNSTIIEETNYVSRRNMPIHAEHTQVLLNAQHVDDVKMESLVNSVPFVDEQFFNTKVFEASYDVLIYSVLMDYTQELYKNKNDNSLLPFGGYQFVLTDESHHEKIVGIYKARGLHLINNDFLRSFTAQYEHIGQITPEHFKLNLEKLRKSIPSEIPIIFVNGSEVDTPNPHEENAPLRHRIMNKALDEFISKSFNCYLLDVRKVITSNDQVEDNIRHYKREMHFNLAGELKKLMEDQIGISLVVNRTTMFSRIKVKIQRRIRNILNKVRF